MRKHWLFGPNQCVELILIVLQKVTSVYQQV